MLYVSVLVYGGWIVATGQCVVAIYAWDSEYPGSNPAAGILLLLLDQSKTYWERLLERIGPIFHSRTYTFRYYPTPSSLLCTNLGPIAASHFHSNKCKQPTKSLYLCPTCLHLAIPETAKPYPPRWPISVYHDHIQSRDKTMSLCFNQFRNAVQFLHANP